MKGDTIVSLFRLQFLVLEWGVGGTDFRSTLGNDIVEVLMILKSRGEICYKAEPSDSAGEVQMGHTRFIEGGIQMKFKSSHKEAYQRISKC